jgi:hypothetical protein
VYFSAILEIGNCLQDFEGEPGRGKAVSKWRANMTHKTGTYLNKKNLSSYYRPNMLLNPVHITIRYRS